MLGATSFQEAILEFYVCSIKIYLFKLNLDLFLVTLCMLGNVAEIAEYGRHTFF